MLIDKLMAQAKPCKKCGKMPLLKVSLIGNKSEVLCESCKHEVKGYDIETAIEGWNILNESQD